MIQKVICLNKIRQKMEKGRLYVYDWHVDEDETEITCVRIYGVNENNKNICLRVDDFTPYVYVELPDRIPWDQGKAQIAGNKIDELLGSQRPLKKELMMKKRLYGAELNEKGEYKLFPYLFCSFSSSRDIKTLRFKLRRNIHIVGVGSVKLKLHETDADPILQLTCCRNIPTAGWINFAGKEVINDKITLCDHEYKVKWKNLSPHNCDFVAKPKIMGFDIEVNSTNPSAMPQAKKPGDKVFQISCVFCRYEDKVENYEKYLLTLGQPDQDIVGEDVLVYMYDTESDLLEGFTEVIREENPNIIVGYNILGFDIPYMIERARFNMCIFNFDKQSFHKYNHSREKTIKWSSSAYKNQEFQYLDSEGRLYVDLLPLVRRDFSFSNYKLKTIADHFLGQSKDPLSVKGIFKCYRLGIKTKENGEYGRKAQRAMGLVGKYCVQDSVLVCLLMDKLQTWVGLTEMAKTCNVKIFTLYTQGQQIKVYSQLYKYSMSKNIVVENDAYQVSENERYIGAHVFPPVPGRYKNVVPFDFCLTGDTLISLSNGLSIRLEQMYNIENVLTYDRNYLTSRKFINGLQDKGIRNTVKIYMQTGETITCTPEHKFMLDDGSWCMAKDLKGKKVKRGICNVEDKRCELELTWKYQIGEFIMDMNQNRLYSLVFSRILGYIYADGSIYTTISKGKYTRECSEACFGTILDANCFSDDLRILGVNDVNIRKRQGISGSNRSKKGCTYVISIPANISKIIHSIKGIIIGKRSTQAMKLPDFILDNNCPKSIIREFLAGMFGGDGCAPYLTNKNTFGSISFKWTTVKKYITNMQQCMISIQNLLKKIGVESNILDPLLIKYAENSIKPTDYIENPRYDIQLNIPQDNTVNFATKIGFRYCMNKMCRLDIVKTYRLMEDNTRKQHSFVISRTNELIEKNIGNTLSRIKGSMTFSDCLSVAQKELLDNEPNISIYSLSSLYDIGYRRGEVKRHPGRTYRLSLQAKKFIKPKEYISSLGVSDWFNIKGYAISQDDNLIPTYIQTVLDVRDSIAQQVYDIEIEDTHNFLANGIVSHNCSLYPTTIIAYNIDYHTWVKDDSNIPDSMCHVMEWEDHNSCIHDPKIIRMKELDVYIDSERTKIKKLREKRNSLVDKIRKKEIMDQINQKLEELKPYTQERSNIAKTKSKNPMCAKRYYRFLKEPKGVLPTIIQNLLDARKHTRKVDMKNINSKIKELESDKKNDHSKKITELKSLLGVLDKRQLAYKICSNSMYGAMGVRRGYLPFMPGAMATTYMGRVNIEKVANTIVNKYGGELVYGDTDCCLKDTPVLVKSSNSLIYTTVDELSDGEWSKLNEFKEISKAKDGYCIWSDSGFTPIKCVVRCYSQKPMCRVVTHTGVVECSEEHSLLTENLQQVSSTQLNIGDKLCTSELPLPSDTPKKPLYNNKITEKVIEEYVIPDIIVDGVGANIAFVWGLFFADGHCGVCVRKTGYQQYTWQLNNSDYSLLERCQKILENKYENLTFKILETMKSSAVYKLVPKIINNHGKEDIADFVMMYRCMFYDSRKYKTVPNQIYNLPVAIRQSFFMGYYAGDGSKKDPAVSCSNKGTIGTAGLFFLMRSIGYKVSVNIRNDKPDVYKLSASTPEQNFRYDPKKVKKLIPFEISKDEYIYDIQTENHHFSAGIGQLVVHNSNYIHFPAMEHKATPELWDWAEYVAEEVTKLFPPPINFGRQQVAA